MYLYLIHCGYYDKTTSFNGVFESHTNFFLVAESVEVARQKAKATDFFKSHKMHIDGIQQIEVVDGYRIMLREEAIEGEATKISSFQFRDLASKHQTQ